MPGDAMPLSVTESDCDCDGDTDSETLGDAAADANADGAAATLIVPVREVEKLAVTDCEPPLQAVHGLAAE